MKTSALSTGMRIGGIFKSSVVESDRGDIGDREDEEDASAKVGLSSKVGLGSRAYRSMVCLSEVQGLSLSERTRIHRGG